MAGFRFRRAKETETGGVGPLGFDATVEAFIAAVESLKLRFVHTGSGHCRIFGPPDRLDSYRLTEVVMDDESLTISCGVPVLIPPVCRGEALRFCLGLNTQARVGFAIGRRGTPVVTASVRLIGALADAAASLCINAFETVWMYSASAEGLFQSVVAGTDADAMLERIKGDGALFAAMPINLGSAEGPKGFEWVGAADEDLPLPPGMEIPEGMSERHLKGVAAALSRVTLGAGPIVDACGGPLLIHDDGVVECFGCTDPAANIHADGTTVSCRRGMRLGQGHRCEWCAQPIGSPQ
jgi:hypothetical protein